MVKVVLMLKVKNFHCCCRDSVLIYCVGPNLKLHLVWGRRPHSRCNGPVCNFSADKENISKRLSISEL